MTDEHRYHGLEAELGALRNAAVEPHPSLEHAVVERLRGTGMIASPRSARLKYLLTPVAAVVLLAMGVVLGRITATPNIPEFTYALLLEEGADFKNPGTEAGMQARVNEYRKWAAGLRESGVAISGMKLKDAALTLGGQDATVSSEILAGMFSIRASSFEQAKKIAETCPHLRYGGKVVIRPIEKT